MSLKDQVLAAAETALANQPHGLTVEALARPVSTAVGRQLPPRQIADALRGKPERFVEGGDGRWRLRERLGILTPEDDPEPTAEPARTRPSLRRGCYIVFDLEATGPTPQSAETELLQIAAQRFVDGVAQVPWMTYVRPAAGTVPAQITALTSITSEQVRTAPDAAEALRQFFTYVGELPLIAHNGATFDGPLIEATCRRLGVSLPPTWRVLDTLPLARVMLPTAPAHRVGTLAERFGCANANAHQADADVQMLCGILAGLQQLLDDGPTGWAVYELLRKGGDPWVEVLTPPATARATADVLATFGTNLVALLPDRAPTTRAADLLPGLNQAYTRAEAFGRSRRPAQQELSRLAAERFMHGGVAAIEAGTGTGKSQGYLIPAALAARAGGPAVAVSTFTRVLQNQLVQRELPFVQQLVPDLTFAQLQGRRNYLSLSRLAEEVEDALAEDRLPLPRAWALALLLRFAEASEHGNLEELGYIPQSLDEFVEADGAVWQVIASVRSSRDDPPAAPGQPDFYARARANGDRADVVIVNHALLLNLFLRDGGKPTEDDDEPFTRRVVCDEAHTLEEAATLALERRTEERILRRMLRALHDHAGRSGLTSACRRNLGLPAGHASLTTLAEAVDNTGAALDSLADQLRRFVNNQTVVSQEDLRRYGVRLRIDASHLSAAGGPALRTAAESLQGQLTALIAALGQVIADANTAIDSGTTPPGRRPFRVLRLARSLQRDLQQAEQHYRWFWSFADATRTVRIVELGRQDDESETRQPAPVAMSAVPINVGPTLWLQVWSRLDTLVCTSATLTVYGQGLDFFLGRVGLEPSRLAAANPPVPLVTHELPHAFDYHNQALLMLPGDLPAPRDTDLQHNFPVAVANLLRRFIPFFRGKTLALFTANSRRDFVHDRIADPLATQGYTVLRQGMGSLPQLIERFREEVPTSLLGSRSLWEGVDVPGESLSYVFLEKLPYPSIGDPVESARMNAVEAVGGDPFHGYLLPKMVILFKQGFGRLIRSSGDRGAAILLDKRLRGATYRTEVLRSLPDPTVGYESDVELFRRIGDWMGLPFRPEELPAPTVSDIARILAENQLPERFVAESDFATIALPRLLAVQQAVWGQDRFRPGQADIIKAVLAGKDVLTLLPTGAGKSRTYQVPALIRPGLTLVISPLIALIRDQVEKLREVEGMTFVAALVSGMDAGSQEDVLRAAAAGRLKLLYVSPERLRDPRFRTYLPQLPLIQLVVDEAHCIATWGHDFRPDFLDISRLLPSGPGGQALPIHALTATATTQVQTEVVESLGMGRVRERQTFTGDFVRDNLIFRMYHVARREERDALTIGIVTQLVRNREKGGSGIVYVATRKDAVQMAHLFRDRNIAAQAYHGGMPTPERHQVQERFMQGELDVVVATTAFGMGVDKAEIRFVLHYDHPASLEAYVQEAGRAGRDGNEAYAILLYHKQTQRTQRFIASQGVPQLDVIHDFADAVRNVADTGTGAIRLPDGAVLCVPEEIARLAGDLEPTQARVLLFAFEEAGLVRRGPDCTTEATVLLNRAQDDILAALEDPADRQRAATLFQVMGATIDRQVTYQAGEVSRRGGLDPREADPLLTRLAAQEWLIYRPYARGITLSATPALSDPDRVRSIEGRFAERYQLFENRLLAMLEYVQLRPGQGRCRSAHLVNYLTGRSDTPRCGKCDLCSPTSESLPWDPGVRLYGEPLAVDIRLSILGAVRDHNGWFGRWTVERMLLGIPQTNFQGNVQRLSPSALASDHFGELQGAGASPERVRRTMDALIEGGFLQLQERQHRASLNVYQAISITQRGRDALAGGVELPEPPGEGA